MMVAVLMGVNSQCVQLQCFPAWVGDNCMHVLLMVLLLSYMDYWNQELMSPRRVAKERPTTFNGILKST